MTINEETKRRELDNRYELRNRYVFVGKLVMQTALHIGGGRSTLSSSDSPVVLTPDQKPFIPGSSFKGALRSTVEKIVPSLPAAANLYSCALIELDENAAPEQHTGGKVCSTMRQSEITQERRKNPGNTAWLKEALRGLCDTCLLFGSPFAAARLSVDDLYLSPDEWSEVIQTRVNPASELSLEDDGKTYFVRKVLVGHQCFRAVEVLLRYSDLRGTEISREVRGGTSVN